MHSIDGYASIATFFVLLLIIEEGKLDFRAPFRAALRYLYSELLIVYLGQIHRIIDVVLNYLSLALIATDAEF